MMNGWVKLKDIAHVLNGYAFKSNNYVKNGIRIIRITNVQKGYMEDNDPKFYPIEALEEVKGFRLYENDLLMSLTGNVGRVAFLRKEMLPAALNQRVACIRIKEGAQVKKEFLYHFMNSDVFELKCIESANGVAQKNLSTEWLKEFRLYLPSIEKQGIITKVLDHLSDLITREKQQLKDLDLLIKSRFIEMFDGNLDRNITLKEVSTKGPQNGFYKKDAEINGTIPIIKMKQLFANEAVGEARDCDKVALTEKELENFKLTSRDLLFGRRSLVVEGAGKCRRVGRLEKNMIFESSLLRITLNEELLLPRFLQIWLETEEGKNSISSIRAVTTIAGIKGSDLARLKVPTPPISLQKSFLDFVAQVDKSKLAVQQSLNELETLKKSLMQQYFG